MSEPDVHNETDVSKNGTPKSSAATWITAIAKSAETATESTVQRIERQIEISYSALRLILPAVPEIMLSRHKATARPESVRTWNLDADGAMYGCDGILTCHALSPMGDTLALLADLGRVRRIAAATGKPAQMLLAAADWSAFNRVAVDYGSENLYANETWRVALYPKLGIDVKVCRLDNVPHASREDIQRDAAAYSSLATSLMPSGVRPEKLDANQVQAIKEWRKRAKAGEVPLAFFKNHLVDRRVTPDMDVIAKVAEHLKRIDVKTFVYYLTQRYHQYAFRHSLKVAVRSELNFDKPFASLDEANPPERQGVSRAIYFHDYALSADGDGERAALPYYFPSGSLYVGRDRTFDDYRAASLLLDDLVSPAQVKQFFERIPVRTLARLVADILSYLHFVMSPFDDGRIGLRAVGERVVAALRVYDSELTASWKYYSREGLEFRRRLHRWFDLAMSAARDDVIPPYHFIPFRIAEVDPEKLRQIAVALCEIVSDNTDAQNVDRGDA